MSAEEQGEAMPNGYWGKVLKDRGNDKPGEVKTFKIEDNFWLDFSAECRED